MKKMTVFLCAVLLVFGAGNVNAELHDRGGGLIYDDVLDITWLQDANYGAGSLYDDGFDRTDGRMAWGSAAAWACHLEYYDSVRGVIWTDWRLPKSVNGPFSATCDGTATGGWNVTSSELGYMFYVNLGNLGSRAPDCTPNPSYGVENTGPFNNLQNIGYWSGTIYVPAPGVLRAMAFLFYTGNGEQDIESFEYTYYTWAVRDGDVGPAPNGVDADGDGIEDSTDTSPVYSDDFNDGMTTGTIIDRGDQVVTVTDEPDPDGVRISAAGGSLSAMVTFCGGSATLTLTDGDEVVVTCGSVEIEVITNLVEISFVADDGTAATTILNAGNSLTFDPENLTITAPLNNTEDALIVVDGKEFSIEPGESVELDSTIVIDGCDSGVLDSDYEGQSISEWINQCATNAQNHGKFVSCVAKLTKKLKKAGIITDKEKGVIQSCTAKADIP